MKSKREEKLVRQIKNLKEQVKSHRFAATQFRKLWKDRGDVVRELDRSLELIRDSDMRGIEIWRAAHPETKGMVWPDRGKMIFWLLERLDGIENLKKKI